MLIGLNVSSRGWYNSLSFMKKKVIVRIKGGLGNQLFCYAAARRLAVKNNAELVIDNISGFVRDKKHRRSYSLDNFSITSRKANYFERMEPFGRYRRLIMKYISRKKPFEKRTYIEQEKKEFDPRLLHYRVNGRVYIDSLWQDERYFNDIEDVIRNDLKIIPPNDESNQKLSKQIRNSNSVAIHVRWFASPDSFPKSFKVNVCLEYYRRAIDKISLGISSPTYFLFSDHPENASRMIGLSGRNIRCVCHNKDEAAAYADIWLMSQCKHFIIANSTFSWWGAWLASNPNKIVLCPNFKGSWNFQRLVPKRWELIDS